MLLRSTSISKFLISLFLWLAVLVLPSAAQEPTNALRVLSWNVFLKTGVTQSGRNSNARAPLIAQAVLGASPDVVVFNEMFRNSLRREILEDIEAVFPHQTEELPRPPDIFGFEVALPTAGGIVIASKWPIERIRTQAFEIGNGADTLANKGVVYVRINKDGQRYHIFGTHTQATNDADNVTKFQETRREQFRIMRRFILQQSINLAGRVIIAGDLNVDFYDTEEYPTMLRNLNAGSPDWRFIDTSPATYDETTNHMLAGEGSTRQLLDYTLYSRAHRFPTFAINQVMRFTAPGGINGDAARPDLSDHYAVMGHYRYSDTNRCAADAATLTNGTRAPLPPSLALTTWEADDLCGANTSRPGPVICYRMGMDRSFNWGNELQFQKPRAIDLCRGANFPRQRLACYTSRLNAGNLPAAAIALCRP